MLEGASIIFIAVSTPTKKSGKGANRSLDTSYIEGSARQIANYYNNIELENNIIIVEKSTVPVTTCKII